MREITGRLFKITNKDNDKIYYIECHDRYLLYMYLIKNKEENVEVVEYTKDDTDPVLDIYKNKDYIFLKKNLKGPLTEKFKKQDLRIIEQKIYRIYEPKIYRQYFVECESPISLYAYIVINDKYEKEVVEYKKDGSTRNIDYKKTRAYKQIYSGKHAKMKISPWEKMKRDYKKQPREKS